MSKQDSRTDLPSDISAMALLGFATPGGMEAVQLEEIQARSIRDRSAIHVATNLFCALLVLAISFGSAPIWAIVSWVGALVAYNVIWYTTLRNKDISAGRRATRRDFLEMGRNAGISGVIWGSALPFLGSYGAMPQWLGIWSVSLAMMVYASMVIPSLPIAATAFIAITTLGGFVGWVLHGEYYLALANAALGTLMVFGVMRSAKAQVLYELASNVLHEKSETVSLLLREFEDSGADWLWQTDTARCVTHTSPRFAYALEQDPKAIEGQPLLKLIAGDSWETGRYPEALHELAERLKRREPFSNLIVPVTINGVRRWWELSASPRQSESGSFLGFRGVGSDVTEQRESAEKISHLARFDTLTGLPNRLQLTEALGQALADADQ